VRLDDYKERISYDPNGNIQTYQRNGTGGTMNLNNYAYTYKANTNQLSSITNSVNGANNSYQYDAIGNVTKDEKQHVAFNDWNVYGKLDSLVKDDGTKVKYTYDAAGQRISKRVNDTTEVYVRDAIGNLLSTYIQKGKDKEVVQTELNVYGSGLLGVYKPIDETIDTILLPNGKIAIKSSYKRGGMEYYLVGHTGNTMAVVSDKRLPVDSNNDGKIDYYLPDVASATYTSTYGATVKSYNGDSIIYGLNGQKRSFEISKTAQTALFWEYDGDVGKRWNVDSKPNINFSPYSVFEDNPIFKTDPRGDTVWLYSTTLPEASDLLSPATHTFLVVKTSDNIIHYYVFGPKDYKAPLGGSPLVRKSYNNNEGGYSQDKEVFTGKDIDHLKKVFLIEPPKDISTNDFDKSVIETAESFGKNEKITYNGLSADATTGNCNTSTSTILYKSGVSNEKLKTIDKEMPGLNWGFGKVRPWTKTEQEKAVKEKEVDKKIHQENDARHFD